MRKYTGTKDILARPMSRGDYNLYRGWDLPENEDGDDAGYLVEYMDSPNSNHGDHNGYISWSPADVFDRAYSITETFHDRLHYEHSVIFRNLQKLDRFLSLEENVQLLDKDQKFLMVLQQNTMATYANILAARIEKLEKTTEI